MRASLILSFAVFALIFTGQADAQSKRKPIAPVVQSGTQIRSELGLTGASGWMLIDLTSGKVLDQSNGDRAFVPASVAKPPTAASALAALGPDYRVTNDVLGTGRVKNGRAKGELTLTG